MTQQRPDPSTLHLVSQMLSQFSGGSQQGQAGEDVQKMRALQEQLARLTGEASDENDRVRVTVTAADGLAGLELDPRAMRMPAADLAAEIVSAVRRAAADLAQKRADLTEETGVRGPGSLAEAQAHAEELRSQLTHSLGDLQSVMEKLRSGRG